MDGTTGPATGSIVVGNDAAATADIDSVTCVFTGPDAAQFTITTPMPAGPIAPGGSVNIDFSATPGPGDVFNATLECTVVDGGNTSIYRWPVTAFGAAAIIPTLGWWALLALIGLMVLMAWRGHRVMR